MEFEGKIEVKPKSKISSRAFDVVKSADEATHLRLKGSNTFISIKDGLIIKRKKDSNGNPTDNFAHYTEINNNEEFVCLKDGKEFVLDGNFYAQIVFMNKAKDSSGSYIRSDDGEVYLHKVEVSVPSYKKWPVNSNSHLKGPMNEGKFYVQTEEVLLPNGVRLTLPNDRVRQYGDEWQYRNSNGEWVKCDYRKSVDTLKRVEYILVDNSKIVDVKKLQIKPNGEYVLKNVDGEDLIVGKKTVELEQPFVAGSTMEVASAVVVPRNLLKQQPRMAQDNVQLDFVWRIPNEDGLVKIVVNRFKTKVTFFYKDNHKEVYALHHVVVNNLNPGDKEYRVGKINVVDLGDAGVKIEFSQKERAIAQDVKFINGKLNSCSMNGRNITSIKWSEGEDYQLPLSYTIDGIMLSDIKWHAGEVESCVVHLIDDEGNPVEKEVKDFRTSEYKGLGVTYEIEKIKDIKIDGEKVSFKIGGYQFVDAEIVAGQVHSEIGKCTLKHNGKEEQIDLRTDPRFEQLRLVVNIAIDEQRVVPLVRSKLLAKKGKKYELEADVIQAEPVLTEKDIIEARASGKYTKEQIAQMEKHIGVAKAIVLKDVQHAVKEQENFKRHPFKLTIVDDKNPNETHTISDFNTTYEDAAEFEIDKDILPNLIGKNKVTVKDGDIEIDTSKQIGASAGLITIGLVLCGGGDPISIVLGASILMVGATVGVGTLIWKGIKKAYLKYQNPEKIKKKIRGKAAKRCKENIKQLVDDCKRELKFCKGQYSQKEYAEKSKEIIEKFKFNYRKEVAKLQVLGEGSLRCQFDPTKENKLTPIYYLQYLEYLRKSKTLKNGKKDSPHLKPELKNQLKGLKGDALILKKVELLEQYGGRGGQIKAYKLKRKNFKLFLAKEEEFRAKHNLEGTTPEDYKIQLKNKFNEGRMVWGSTSDKIRAFKSSIKGKNPKVRREMLAKKREELKKQVKNKKVDSVDFDEHLDKKGKPVIESYTQSSMAYLEYVCDMFESGETKIKHKFSFNFYEKLDDKQKGIYLPTRLSDATVRRINVTDNRRIKADKEKAEEKTEKLEKLQRKLSEKIELLRREVNADELESASYEDLVKLELKKQENISNWEKAYSKIDKLIEAVPFVELNEDVVKRTQDTTHSGRVAISKIKIQIEQAKQRKEAEYKAQVRGWARDEFIRRHNNAYLEFIDKNYTSVGPNGEKQLSGLSIDRYNKFVDYMEQTLGKEKFEREMETLQVKHNIEDNVSAEVYCEANAEDYNKFIEERNKQSTTGQLDPNSEIAKCYYFAHCRKANPVGMQIFIERSGPKRKEKAKERLDNGTLPDHKKRNKDKRRESLSTKLAEAGLIA